MTTMKRTLAILMASASLAAAQTVDVEFLHYRLLDLEAEISRTQKALKEQQYEFERKMEEQEDAIEELRSRMENE